jgi:hypothetical protein
MCSVWGVADEIGDAYRGGWSVLVSVDLVLVQFVLLTYECVGRGGKA